MNVSLGSRRKGVLDHLESLLQSQWWWVLHLLILLVDLTVEEGHDQRGSRASSSAELPLIRSYRVIRVHGALSLLVQTSNDGVHVVGEEPLVVEHVLDGSRTRLHLEGLVVLVVVQLDVLLDVLDEGVTVGGKAVGGHQNVVSDVKHLGLVPRVDGVAGCISGIAGQQGEIVSCDSEYGSSVVYVSNWQLVNGRA